MKSTIIYRCYQPYDTIFCPYCGEENQLSQELYDSTGKIKLGLTQICKNQECNKKYLVDHLKENI